MTTYRIRNWKSHFESYEQTRLKARDGLKWVAITTKHDGKTFRRLSKLSDAAAIYGAWILIVAVAGKCPERGTLADQDGPLTPDDLESKTGFQATAFTRAIEVLSSEQFRWLETVESAGIPADQRESPPTIHHTTPHNHTIQNPTPQKPGGALKTRFRLGRKETWEQICNPAGAKRVYEIALASGTCTRDERHHITRLILSLDGNAENPVGALVSILNGGGKDDWRSRGGDFDKQAKEWMNSLDVPPEMRQRTGDLSTGPPEVTADDQKRRLAMFEQSRQQAGKR